MRQSRMVTLRGGDVNARGVASQVAAPPAVDVEAFDGDTRRSDAHHAAVARSEQDRAPAASQRDTLVEDDVTPVDAGGHLDAVAGLRAVDERLQRGGLRRARPALDRARRRWQRIVGLTGRGPGHGSRQQQGECQQRGRQVHRAT